jgi:hypothetical protein
MYFSVHVGFCSVRCHKYLNFKSAILNHKLFYTVHSLPLTIILSNQRNNCAFVMCLAVYLIWPLWLMSVDGFWFYGPGGHKCTMLVPVTLPCWRIWIHFLASWNYTQIWIQATLGLVMLACEGDRTQMEEEYVRFDVFMAVTMKNTVFWDVASYRSSVNRRCGAAYHLHLQGRKIHEQGTSLWRWAAATCIFHNFFLWFLDWEA